MKPLVSVIIPVKKVNDSIKRSVKEILNGTYQMVEIIIVPDTSTGETFSKTKIIASGSTGPAQKRDLGAKAAKGDVLAFLDDDAYPSRQWLEAIVQNLSDTEIAAVGGPGVTPPDCPFWEKASGAILASPLGAGSYTYRFIPSSRRYVDDYPSMNLLVRKNYFRAVGGFDSHYWPGEDTKLCLDLVYKLKKKILYDPMALVYHHRRPLWTPHLLQQGNYGLHRGYFARILPKTSARISYFLPSLLVLLPFLLVPYAILLVANALWILKTFRSIPVAVVSLPGVLLTHYWYGIRFLQGFLFTKKLVQ